MSTRGKPSTQSRSARSSAYPTTTRLEQPTHTPQPNKPPPQTASEPAAHVTTCAAAPERRGPQPQALFRAHEGGETTNHARQPTDVRSARDSRTRQTEVCPSSVQANTTPGGEPQGAQATIGTDPKQTVRPKSENGKAVTEARQSQAARKLAHSVPRCACHNSRRSLQHAHIKGPPTTGERVTLRPSRTNTRTERIGPAADQANTPPRGQ